MGVIYFRGKEQTAGTSVYDLAVAGGFKGNQEEFYQTLATIKQKANTTDVYAKTETYTKTEVDNAIASATPNITIDTALSLTSTNPVQNKIVTSEVNKKITKWVGTKEEYNKIATYDSNTLYIVTDENSDNFIDLNTFKEYSEKVVSTTMTASKWDTTDKTYSFEDTYPNGVYNLDVSIDGDNCTVDQIKAWGNAMFVGSSTKNVLKASKTVPTVDIPIILKVVKCQWQ